MTPTIVGVPRTHPCRRGEARCTGRAPVVGSWCSETCARIDRGVAALPRLTPVHQMTVGQHTVVAHAFDWLDARRRVVA